jgi:plasmid stability protein
MPDDDPDVLYLRMPPDLKSALRVAAARRGTSMANLARELLADALHYEDLCEQALGHVASTD